MKGEVYKIDAAGRAPGRVASEIAKVLQGKNKADWVPNKDNDTVIEVANAGKAKITGKKLEQRVYYHYSGYPGGLKRKSMKNVSPEYIIIHAVKSMMPSNRLLKARMKRLKFV